MSQGISNPTPAIHLNETRYLARQPILDIYENVFGYELPFRGGPETLFSAISSDRASMSTIDYSLTLANATLRNGKRVFINCTRELLVGGLVTLLPPDLTVLEILEDVEADDEVIEACRGLRSLGYSLALDDFTADRLGSPFLELVSFVKADLRLNDKEQVVSIAQRLSSRGLRLIAEKVETREELEFSQAAGYQYFQGYFFCKPTMMKSRDISPAQQSQIRLLKTVIDPELDLRELEKIIRSDVSLCYRLLRYLNSAAFGLYPVRSIMHALTLIGEREVRKWIALVTAASLAWERTPELVRTALVRAKFCELLADRHRADDYFLAGLFSLLDVMLEQPMGELVSELPVSTECRQALLGAKNDISGLLDRCRMLESLGPGGENTESGSEFLWDTFNSASYWTDSLLQTAL
jgi:EAL and modified HD-GYP domain-containing signal transduction protein